MGACHDVICAEGYQYHEMSAGNGRPGSCCATYECRPIMDPDHCNGVVCPDSSEEMCPHDSKAVMGGMSDDGCCILPSRCSCALERCMTPVCSQGYSPRRIASGTLEPGSCCDVYECVVGIVTEGCTHHERIYRDGESWTVGNCKTCQCETGWAHCIVQQDCNLEENQLCLTSRHGIKIHGEKWDEDDCTMCECVDGTSACMTSSCVVRCYNPRTVPGICCPVCDTVTNFITMHPLDCPPPQSNCTLLCPYGYEKDENECPICQCLPEPLPTPSTSRPIPTTMLPSGSEVSTSTRNEAATSTMTTPSSTRHIEIVCPLIDCVESCSNGYVTDKYGCSLCDCLPEISVCEDMSECTRKCAFGFRQDENGCDTCRCQQCKPMDSCTKSCLYGYQMGRHGCLKCKCRKCPLLTDCKKLCTHGFEINDRGCEICKCQASSGLDPKPSTPSEGSCQTLDLVVYDDGESWHDGCRQCYCSNGQEMCSLITCQVPACSKPVIRPDQCCPTCQADSDVTHQPTILSEVCQSASGQYYIEGETWMLGQCTSCMCHAGQVLCSSEVCPPLPCVNPVFKNSRCCAECEDVLPEVAIGEPTLEDTCMLPDGVTFQHGATWKEDSCTSCQCIDGEIMCFSQTCPPVDCDKPLLKKGQCCPTCLDPDTRLVCKSGGDIYVSGETWRVDNCTSCDCEGSRVSCTISHCPVMKCENLVHVAGTCCPVCQDEDIFEPETKRPTKISHTDEKDFDATEPVPSPEKPKTRKPYHDKDSNMSEQSGDNQTPIAAKHHPFPVYPVVMSILVILLAICIVLLLLLFVTKRRHRLLYHVNVKPIGGKGQPPPAITTTAVKTKNTDVKNSNNRDSIRDSAMFKDNLPAKSGVNSVVLDGKDMKRYSDLFAVGKSIQPV
ncbi:cysteine-rich motor neuron 1 protein-like [Lytechinus variegatus]|uniref:cysteine-rich motor neuron 1 protein-like n=1 Tax=Lytechinus variegatus TaxID=7654 RepID=UPI001BB1341C|nr:cysteine-rich motor neuron 1 protein-like [Lytechinus variegatus]